MKHSNSSITTTYLNDLKQAGAPMEFTQLSYSSTAIFFLKSYRRSRIQPSPEVNLTFTIEEKITIAAIKQQTASTSNVSGCIKWLSDVVPVKTHDEKTTHLIEAVLFDETGDLSLTFWEEHFVK